MIDQKEYENRLWIDLVTPNADELTRSADEIWLQNHDQEQFWDTGKLDFDFKDLLALEPELRPLHTPSIKNLTQTMHDGMINNNFMGISEISSEHPVHNALHDKFKIKDIVAYLNVQHPGGVAGMHVDKRRSTFARDQYDKTKLRLKDIYSGIVFLQDWVVGQTFMTGRSCITNWQAGDSYSWPWYMQHGSANAGPKPRYLLQFVGVLV